MQSKSYLLLEIFLNKNHRNEKLSERSVLRSDARKVIIYKNSNYNEVSPSVKL